MSLLDAWRDRIAALLFGAERDHELEMEIAHHLELETQRQIDAGYDPHTARRRALDRFGNPQHIADATRDERGAPLMEGGMQDFRWAVRSLRKNLGFSSLALVTIALGIGTTTAAFTVLDTVLLRPLPYQHAERLVVVRERTDEGGVLPPSYPNFVDWRSRARPFDAVASAMFPFGVTLWTTSDGEPLRAQMLGVSRGFFAALGVSLAAGREFTDAENTPGAERVMMVTYEFWRDHMNQRASLGTVRWGNQVVPVVGVTPPGFRFVTNADVFFPNEQWGSNIRSAHNYIVVGRLRRGVTIETARAEMTSLSKAMRVEYGNETAAVDADVMPLREYVAGEFRLLLSIVFAAAGMVLLIACVNLLSAQLARGWARAQELAVRAALGASRSRLVRQLALETLLLAGMGAALGIGLAASLVAGIRRFGVDLLPRLTEMRIDGRSMGATVAATLLTTLLVGLYPAFRSAGGDDLITLRAGRGHQTIRTALWRALVGFEVGLALMLAVGATLLVRTLHNILNADTGLDTRGVVTATFSPSDIDVARINEFRDDLRAIPGVEGVAFTSRQPFTWGNGAAPIRRPADPIDHGWPALAGFRVVTPEYFAVVRQPLVVGRAFTDADVRDAPHVAIITSGIARVLWPGQNPIGKPIATNYLMKEWLTVVGVVTEATNWSMPRGAQHEIYVPIAQHPDATEGQLNAVFRTSAPTAAVIPSVRARLRQLAPKSASQISTLEDRIARSAADRRFGMLALGAFAFIGLALAGIGIYGVMWYIVTTRTREIGIRMALGATSGLVRAQMLRGALAMAGIGVLGGGIASLFATRYLQSSLYGVSRMDPSTFGIGALVALGAALIGAYVPARRSSLVDPVVAIRAD
jgi:predicted permease